MNLISGIDVTASALTAQKTRLDVVAQNIANAQTTRTASGGPYQRQVVSFETELLRNEGIAGASLQRTWESLQTIWEASQATRQPPRTARKWLQASREPRLAAGEPLQATRQ